MTGEEKSGGGGGGGGGTATAASSWLTMMELLRVESWPVVVWWRRFGESNGAWLAEAVEAIHEVGFQKWLHNLVGGAGAMSRGKGMLTCHVMVTSCQLVGTKHLMTKASGHPDEVTMFVNAAMAPLFLFSAAREAEGGVSGAFSDFYGVFQGLEVGGEPRGKRGGEGCVHFHSHAHHHV